jgi:hypothetical protein
MPASLRSDGVRVHPGMPFGFPSESAFGFAGILRDAEPTRLNPQPIAHCRAMIYTCLVLEIIQSRRPP